MTLICCICNKKEQNELWTDEFVLEENELVSHGYCPHCFREAMEEIKEWTKEPWMGTGCEKSNTVIS